MGAFIVRHSYQDPEEAVVIPNTLHNQGAEWILKRAFEGDSTRSFKMGITGRGGTSKYAPNDFTKDLGIGVKYNDIRYSKEKGNPGGGARVNAEDHPPDGEDAFRDMMNLREQDVGFTVERVGGVCRIVSDEIEFTNNAPWRRTPCSWFESRDPEEGCPPAYRWPWIPFWASRGYPYIVPWLDSREFFGENNNNDFQQAVAGNLHRGASFGVGAIYIITGDELLVSARMQNIVRIRNQYSLFVRWVGDISPQ